MSLIDLRLFDFRLIWIRVGRSDGDLDTIPSVQFEVGVLWMVIAVHIPLRMSQMSFSIDRLGPPDFHRGVLIAAGLIAITAMDRSDCWVSGRCVLDPGDGTR